MIEKMNMTLENVTADYFLNLFENGPSKTLFMGLSMFLMLVSLVLCYSIIWFERFGVDVKRTILNQLLSLQCWTLAEFILCVTLLEWVRYISGPMPSFPCWFHLVIKEGLISKMLLLQTGIVISRYACIFWLKNPSAFNDEFWCQFINRWVNIFSFWPQFVFVYLPGRQRIGYYICAGRDPAEDYALPTKSNITHYIIVCSSLAIHILVSLRIFFYKNKIKNNIDDISCIQKNTILKTLEKQSITDFVTVTTGFISAFIFAYVFFKYSQIEPKNFNQYPYYLFVYWVQLFNAPITTIFLLILYYIKKKSMRTIMIREVNEFLKLRFGHQTVVS
jgi:hypothetical protein